ncbi:MAG: response regulator transcription factor [Candidatus Rokubacteria bacterium]|nr:response regulator transcription factor [Candidatus Rokubacteria bacterium]
MAILDDHRLFREGLRRVLDGDPSLAAAGDGEPAAVRDLIRTASPDVLLVDGRFEGVLALCTELRHGGGRPWVLLLGAEADEDRALKALEAGARGILSRGAGAEELSKAIRVVHDGQIWAGKRVVARLVEELAARFEVSRAEQAQVVQRLSPREREIVQLAVGGLSTQEIADRLAISPATVKAHFTHIFQKLGVRDRLQLAALHHRVLHPTAPR